MERERLTRLLEEPSRMVREDLSDLKAMTRQYPWFSGARLLQAAGEQLSGQVLADETLRTAAAHLPSREALFDLSKRVAEPTPLRVVRTETADAVEAVVPEAEQSIEPQPAQPAPIGLVQVVPAPPAEAEAPAQLVEPTVSEDFAPVVEELGPLPAPAEEEQVEAEEAVVLQPETAEDTVANELESEYVKSAMARAYDLTWQEQLAEAPPEPEPAPKPEAPKAPALTPTARLRFSDWLQAADQESAAFGTGESRVGQAHTISNAGTIPAAIAVTSPAPSGTGAKPSAEEQAKQALDAKALIDRFIRQQPPEIPAKPSFFTPQQAGKKSLDDSAGLVTETLARIYEQQGNYAKAVEAYERLALKYPEKSAYFAALSKAAEAKLTL
ncbi:MAG: tetratricopeptide repeat protein [Flavobacteriales bacterium]